MTGSAGIRSAQGTSCGIREDIEMLNFKADRACPKCGLIPALEHHSMSYDKGLDLISRVCKFCRYTWSELPVDRKDAEPKKRSGLPIPAFLKPKDGGY